MDDGDESESQSEKSWDDRLIPALAQLIDSSDAENPAALEELMGFLRRAAGGQAADADDVASTILVGLLLRFQSDSAPIDRPAAYLRRAARNGRLRLEERRNRAEPTDAQLIESRLDRESFGAFADDRVAARELLFIAFDEARRRGDTKGVQTAAVWLDLDDEFQRQPTSREIAECLKVDHTTVLRRLKRLRTYAEQGI